MMTILRRKWIAISISLILEVAIEALLNIEVPDLAHLSFQDKDPWIKIEFVC